RITIALSDRVVALSNQDRREQIELNLGPEDKFSVVQNGINFEAYNQNDFDTEISDLPGLPVETEGPVILNVGRLVREKGQATLIEAVHQLRSNYPGVMALLVGDGPNRDHLLNKIDRLDLEEHVKLVGSVSNVEPYYHRADLFCFPSQYESQGMAVMEAMAAGLPVISTIEGGLAELIEPGKNALVVRPGEPDEITSAVSDLLDNDQKRRRLAEAAQETIRGSYTLDALTNRTISLYRTVLGQSE
ncbi:MAG: glycosyltransferase family 4 protein, partial [bacterium]